jgi:hypothetical protein
MPRRPNPQTDEYREGVLARIEATLEPLSPREPERGGGEPAGRQRETKRQ